MRKWLLPVGVGLAIASVVAVELLPSHGPRASKDPVRTASSALAAPHTDAGAVASSNVLPSDYVGPEACEACHAERYRQWRDHPHSRMNQNADEKSVRGDFNGARLTMPQGEARFSREAGAFTMTLERAGKPVRKYQVTRTVGSRFMQFYIGRQTEGPEPKTHALYTTEAKLPFAYWFRLKRWLPESYFDPFEMEHRADGSLTHEPFDRPEVLAFSQNCMVCHNTYPYVYRLGVPAPRMGFPSSDLHVDVPAVRVELDKALGPSTEPGIATITRLRPEHLTRLGVSCESCHFGGRSHVNGEGKSLFLPTSPLFSIEPNDPQHRAFSSSQNAYAVVSICTQCHSAKAQTFPNGAGVSNSREALDLQAGACTSKIKCNDCHDPHRAGAPEAAPDAPAHVDACVRCHGKYREPAAAKAHAGSFHTTPTCLDCHMPRISQGLDEAVRSHRISSPADWKMFAARSVNACNLCHLDKSFAWTLDELGRTWKVAAADRELQASSTMAQPAGLYWLRGENPNLRFVAGQAFARSPLGRDVLGDLVTALDDDMAVNRVFGVLAIERISGKTLSISDFDAVAARSTRMRQIEKLRAQLAR